MFRRGTLRFSLVLMFGVHARTILAAAEPKPLIQIGVEVVEVDESKARQLGIDWLSELKVFEQDVPALLEVGTLSRDQLFANLQALLTEGGADLLANPKLVARDGTSATFRAGGEFPYAVAGSLGTTSIEFKPYGISLRIEPHREGDGRIAMTLDAEVSSPDTQSGVQLSGNTVPAIRTRSVSSQVSLEPGNTLTLAGLIQNEKEWTRRGIPGLMRIPLLGYLFSHRTLTHRRTSIVVFVSPTLLEGGHHALAQP